MPVRKRKIEKNGKIKFCGYGQKNYVDMCFIKKEREEWRDKVVRDSAKTERKKKYQNCSDILGSRRKQ